jgi:YVTN family beta-propeller protein
MTHAWNNDQRMADLPFTSTATAGGSKLSVRLPSRQTDTPPGFYMVFAFDARGVPSVAKIIRVNTPGARPDASAPVMADIPDQDWTSGAVKLQPVATSPVGATLRYSASGLPAGLSMSATTGAVTGTPTQSGTHFVTVSADDGRWTASRSFLWTVSTSDPLPQTVSPGPLSVGSTLNVTAAGGGSLYSWDFGDGSPATAATTTPAASHTYTKPGVFAVTVTAYNAQGLPSTSTFLQTVSLPATAGKPAQSSQMALTGSGAAQRLWLVNPDSHTVSVFDTAGRKRVAEIAVGEHPVALAEAADGRVWVSNERSATISIIDPTSLRVLRNVSLPSGSQPWGLARSGQTMYAVLQGMGQLVGFNTGTFARTGAVAVGANPRHVSVRGDGLAIYVSRFITPALPGEGTSQIRTAGRGGELVRVDAASFTVGNTIVLAHSERVDAENQGRGIPNYLGAMAISPDGTQAFVPSKQDNIKRGTLRDGQNLNFQNTVRAISSRVVMASETENLNARIDHDNASLATAAAFDPRGVYLFVALETSREVAVVNAHNQQQLMRIDTGMAPQSLAVSDDGMTLYVGNFMSRSLGVYDLSPLVNSGLTSVPLVATLSTTAADPLSAQVLKGKQLFYDARDTRLARDRYMSCASCHDDGGHDGRVWDLTGHGEGLRNTISLRGRAGTQHRRMHWSANFDEVQDFEGQIRTLAGGSGLMSNAAFNTGTRHQPLGDRKAGVSDDLDALAAYVSSLTSFEVSPFRTADGSLTPVALAGKQVFVDMNCAQCHGGTTFAASADNSQRKNIGTIKASSGMRLGSTLDGIDVPTLRDVWKTAPYLHDGSAATLTAAVMAHNRASMGGVVLDNTKLGNLVAYLQQIGAEEPAAIGNLALGKTATQTSDYGQASASLAVDGNTDGVFLNRSVSHTGSTAAQNWWQVDLGRQSAIESVEIWNRTDCCNNRLSKFHVFVSANDMSARTQEELLADPSVSRVRVGWLSTPSISLALPSRGRYVKVQLEGSNYLSLAEVKVFGSAP